MAGEICRIFEGNGPVREMKIEYLLEKMTAKSGSDAGDDLMRRTLHSRIQRS